MHSLNRFVRCASVGLLLLGGFAAVYAGVEPSPFHGASNRVTLPLNPALKPRHAIFTLAQPVAAHARINGAMTAAQPQAAAPREVGQGFDYLVRQVSLCQCSCLADPACDDITDVRDVVGVVAVAFRGAASIIMSDCQGLQRTDANCSGNTDVLDVVKIVNVAFRGGDPAVEFCQPCQ